MCEGRLTTNEQRLIQIIRDGKDPAKAMVIGIEIMQRMLAGESTCSIMKDYSFPKDKIE